MKDAILCYSEKEFRRYFEEHLNDFGFEEIILSQKTCPDYVLKMKGGRVVKVEAELFSINFKYHQHDAKKVDYIICCYSSEKSLMGVPIIAANPLWVLEETTTRQNGSCKKCTLRPDEKEMLEFIVAHPTTTFAEISRNPEWSGNYCLFHWVSPSKTKGALRGYPKTTSLLSCATRSAVEHMRKYCHFLIAAGLSNKACETIDALLRKRLIYLSPCDYLCYMIDGAIYDSRLWIPVAINVTEMARKKYKHILDPERLAHKMIESIGR